MRELPLPIPSPATKCRTTLSQASPIKNRTMNPPTTRNDVPLVTATDSSAPSEPKETRELSNSEAPATGGQAEEGRKKPANKRGVRGPRSLRRARPPRQTQADGAFESQAVVAEGAATQGQSTRIEPNGRKRDDRQKGKPGQKTRGKPVGARPQQGRSKGGNADDVFSFVTSAAYDDEAESGDNRQARNVRRDLTAE